MHILYQLYYIIGEDEPKQDDGIITIKTKTKVISDEKTRADGDGDGNDEEDEDEEYTEEDMMAMMGFSGFNTTKVTIFLYYTVCISIILLVTATLYITIYIFNYIYTLLFIITMHINNNSCNNII